MSKIKEWLENLSVEIGLGGQITDAVIEEGDKRMKAFADARVKHHVDWLPPNRGNAGVLSITLGGMQRNIEWNNPPMPAQWAELAKFLDGYSEKIDELKAEVEQIRSAYDEYANR